MVAANMPVQVAQTNDCGIWMCMVATAYINKLFEDGSLPLIPSSDIAREHDINATNVVEVLIDAKDLPKDCRTAGDRSRAVGRLGREHMLRSLRTSNWVFRESLFKNVMKIHK